MKFVLGLALVLSAATTALMVPLWRKWCWRLGWLDEPGHRKIHGQPVALAGGMAVFTGLLLAVAGLMLVAALRGIDPSVMREFTQGLNSNKAQWQILLAGVTGMVFLGWLDDTFELRPAAKLSGQLLVAVMTAGAGLRFSPLAQTSWLGAVVTVGWMVVVTNATNFQDNMNGLCAGLGVIAAVCFAVMAWFQAQFLNAGVAFLLAGALLGFLPYNYPRASVFLGDAGSHLTGYGLAILPLLPHSASGCESTTRTIVAAFLVLAVPLGDLLWVVILRWSRGKPVYIGDTNHLSHRLVRCGISAGTAVLVIWLVAAFFGGLAVFLASQGQSVSG